MFQECCHTRQKWNLWVCGFVSACSVCVFLNMCLYVCVFSYPHLYRRHCAAPLTPDYLFVLQFSLIFSFCGGHVHFTVVTHSHTFAVTLGLKIIMHTLWRTHTQAGQHVLKQFRTRTLPFAPFCMGSQVCPISHADRHYLFVSGCDYNCKFTFMTSVQHGLSFTCTKRHVVMCLGA